MRQFKKLQTQWRIKWDLTKHKDSFGHQRLGSNLTLVHLVKSRSCNNPSLVGRWDLGKMVTKPFSRRRTRISITPLSKLWIVILLKHLSSIESTGTEVISKFGKLEILVTRKKLGRKFLRSVCAGLYRSGGSMEWLVSARGCQFFYRGLFKGSLLFYYWL